LPALRTSTDVPVAVVATARPLPELPIDLHRLFAERCDQVDVGELQRADVHELLRRRGLTVTTEMLDRIWSLGRGNPLHTELLAAQVTDDGRVPERVPRSIAALYGERIERLDRTHLRVLEHAMVFLQGWSDAFRDACARHDGAQGRRHESGRADGRQEEVHPDLVAEHGIRQDGGTLKVDEEGRVPDPGDGDPATRPGSGIGSGCRSSSC